MNSKTFQVEVKRDHLSKIANTSPERGLAELLWNSLDSDCTRIEIKFKSNQIGVNEIIVSDNGHGFSIGDAEVIFRSLGGSWKAAKRKTDGGREVHGKQGEGRFRAFSLGRHVEWIVVHKNKNGTNDPPYSISASADQIEKFFIKDAPNDSRAGHGVTVRITEPQKEFKIFDTKIAVAKLIPVFALYLKTYRNIKISINETTLDPDSAIKSAHTVQLKKILDESTEYSMDLEIIEWKDYDSRELWLCSESGFPIEKYPRQIRGVGDFGFSAYLRSKLFEKLDKNCTLSLGDLLPSVQEATESAVRAIKNYFARRLIELGQETIRRWKEEDIYPFPESAESPVETAERELFDVVATKIAENIPTFEKSEKKLKAFQLRMLRHAVERGPDELQNVITEVLNLPQKQLEQLSELLQNVSLTSVISASKMVTDRLKFIAGLEFILFNPESKSTLKERSQLHKILAENTWIFGQEFSVSVNDRSLTEVLRKHQEKIGVKKLIDEPALRIDGSVGIVDLMLSRSIPRNNEDEIEHLVVELKSPKTKIGEKECSQIKNYAFAVIEDERFTGLSAKWNFWIISNELETYAQRESNQDNRPRGVIYRSKDRNDITVWAKTWSQILRENRFRLEFIRNRLNYEIDHNDGLQHLRENYSQFLKGVIIENSINNEN